ncbi:MAG TPA: hypothetical protein VMF51_15920 [Nocardioides sp.]|uniref:hypothetical protein n=1 Tax=Nocardioides sp. TaxID=35761 RepID=UPI002D03B124|nr:hypothetical protein [Nocardioides sp.]HTW16626.1 hypothetical protein [Nocardioides sp.]
MTLTLTFVKALESEHACVSKPYLDLPGFRVGWWTGQCHGQVAFASFTDEFGVEVARAQIKLEALTGLAYPTWDRPEGGVTEIDLIEVRDTARGSGLGTEAVHLLVAAYGPPVIALAKNESAEAFWRQQPGWVEHLRETDSDDGPEAPKGMPLFVWNGSAA